MALDPATAQALPWAPEPDYGVEAMELFGNHLIAAGSFITMNGDTCNKVALLDLAAADAQSWDPQLYPQLYGDVQEVVVLGNKVMLAGGFTHAAGTDREGMAVFELPTTLGQGPTSLAEENGLAIPNPFSAQLHLVLPADDHGPWSYALHDPAGRPLRQGRLSADGLITGLEGLAPGSYVVCATSVRSRILAQVVKTDR